MNIGIRIDDADQKKIDLSNPVKGNPGIGGTQYEAALLADQLKSVPGINIFLYHFNADVKMPINTKCYVVESEKDIINRVIADKVDIIIYACGIGLSWYDMLENNGIKSIAWAHCYLNHYELKKIKKCSYVRRVVFVGREEYSAYIADDIIQKSIYIYNMFPIVTQAEIESEEVQEKENKVIFLGAINKDKGFHILAKAWKKVVNAVPDAVLEVIGSGKLYNRSAKMGTYGIASADYERRFIKYITNDQGILLDSVHFRGILGEEKRKVISTGKVGVVNPSGLTETFCISAVEIESQRIPICTTGKFGLLDTVKDNETGLFSYNDRELANNIIRLLKDDELRNRLGLSAARYVRRFSPEIIIPDWVEVFHDIFLNCDPKYIEPTNNDSLLKFKKTIRMLRFDYGFTWVPSFIRFEFLFQGMWRVFIRDIIRNYFH